MSCSPPDNHPSIISGIPPTKSSVRKMKTDIQYSYTGACQRVGAPMHLLVDD